MKDKLSSEYLETQFEKETLTPTIDFFLIYSIYNNKRYEVPIRREYSGNKYHYWVLEGSVKKPDTGMKDFRLIFIQKVSE